jgi:2-dehydro-3-deoxy-D-arabinonate dehydratase
MTSLVRYRTPSTAPQVGIVDDEGAVRPVPIGSMADLLAQPLDRIDELVARARTEPGVSADSVELHAPIDGVTPVWAAGVTYTISRDARVEESDVTDVYTKVYDAERPELFFKAAAHDVMTDGDPVGRRDDSLNDTPEPELGLVTNQFGDIVAYAAVNDMSSRSIEGENPLYLPQAKMFAGSCVVAPTLRLASEVADPLDLTITMRIHRGGRVVFDGEASTGRLRRTPWELVEYLFRALRLPGGAVLSTGTCLVPALDSPVLDGDVVEIAVEEIGRMTNNVTPTSQLLRIHHS